LTKPVFYIAPALFAKERKSKEIKQQQDKIKSGLIVKSYGKMIRNFQALLKEIL